MKELIQDVMLFDFSRDRIDESIKENGGRLIVKGILQRAETRNQNGRVYPRNILEREANRYKESKISQRMALGELDHPDSSVINLKNVSHNIIDVNWDGDDLIGTVEVLSTPSGNILKELFRSGIKLGISSRGMGSVKSMDEDGKPSNVVQDDFELLGWDFVSNPSTHGAFMSPTNEGRLMEGVQENVCTTFCRAQSLMHEILTEIQK